MRVLITGGTGYIGSNCASALLRLEHEVVLLDNLSNSSEVVCNKIFEITNKKVTFFKGDISDTKLLNKIFASLNIDAVIHCAGLKSASESIKYTEKYYYNNFLGTKNLIQSMQQNKVFKLIFSSSATVYGRPSYLPIDENHPINPINPYGSTKVDAEGLLKKFAQKNLSWKILSLRYFNPIGADDSYLLGDNPSGYSDNLFPFLLNVASGKENYLKVFGNNYDTHDGTGIRDYIHILDLVDGHIAALLHLDEIKSPANYDVINLGSGKGFSVLDVINNFEKVTKVSIPYKYYPERDGDVASSFADNIKAFKSLKWTNRRTLNDMCKSAWEFKKLSKS